MVTELKPYPEYKNSGVCWLGKVPTHWRVRRAKHTFSRIVSGSTPSSHEPRYWGGVHVWVTPADVSKTARIRGSERQLTQEGLRSCSAVLVPAGSIVVTSRAPVGNVALGEVGLCTNQGCKALVPNRNEIDSSFGFSLFRVLQAELQSLAKGTTFTEVSGSTVGDLKLPLPPLSEQGAIVRFLDHADRRIRRYIRAKQKLITLLEEQKQAMVHEAVTGQIDVRTGRPYPAYKDSGMEWLGNMPAHWNVRRLGQVARIFNGSTPSRARHNYWTRGTVPWLNSGKVNEQLVLEPSELITERAVRECSLSHAPRGSVILGLVGQGRTRGMSAMLGINATINQNMAAIVPDGLVEGAFVHYQLTAFYRHVREIGRGGNQEALNCDLVSRLRLPIPPREEQDLQIIAISRTIKRVDRLARLVRRQIDLLQELGTRMIAEVVTGKANVREAAAKLPDVDSLAMNDTLDDQNAKSDLSDSESETA